MFQTTEERLRVGFILDNWWFGMKENQADKSKEWTLLQLVDVLNSARVPYAIIGGVALQVHSSDPRTTMDIDVALPDRSMIPVDALEAAGFRHTGSFDHSENFQSPDGIAVQFSAAPEWVGVVERAAEHLVFGKSMRFLTVLDMVRAKLRSATEPTRRRSKALRDATDIATLTEEHADILDQLTESEKMLVQRLTARPGEWTNRSP